jgi:predicted nucleic acid-binding protein
MTKREVNYPHTISFRLTDEVWLRVEQEVAETNLTAHEWCRLAVLERLNRDHGLSKSERFLFEHFARAQYLVTQGFQLLADDNLTAEEWKKFRAIANERTSEIADVALAMHAKRNGQSR